MEEEFIIIKMEMFMMEIGRKEKKMEKVFIFIIKKMFGENIFGKWEY